MGRSKGSYPEHIRAYNEKRKKATHCKYGHLRTPESQYADGGCRLCKKQRAQAYRQEHPMELKKWHKAHHLLVTYGLTSEEYNRKLDSQKNCCAICNRLMDSPHVDHDHETDVVRDLLCKQCNLALGYLHDDVKIAQAVVAYLERWKNYAALVNIAQDSKSSGL
jgi:hypothetical protein